VLTLLIQKRPLDKLKKCPIPLKILFKSVFYQV
jgi:hypothetical protein